MCSLPANEMDAAVAVAAAAEAPAKCPSPSQLRRVAAATVNSSGLVGAQTAVEKSENRDGDNDDTCQMEDVDEGKVARDEEANDDTTNRDAANGEIENSEAVELVASAKSPKPRDLTPGELVRRRRCSFYRTELKIRSIYRIRVSLKLVVLKP
jgi:hypothetical protein